VKKFLSILVLAAFMLTTVIGCSGTPSTPPKTDAKDAKDKKDTQ
jgi:hypothetical protein